LQIVQALATNVLVTQFEPGLHLELLESERATHTVGVPTMWLAVIDHPDFAPDVQPYLQKLYARAA